MAGWGKEAGQALSGVAKAFEPPSPQELQLLQAMKINKAKEGRQKRSYDAILNPESSQGVIDRHLMARGGNAGDTHWAQTQKNNTDLGVARIEGNTDLAVQRLKEQGLNGRSVFETMAAPVVEGAQRAPLSGDFIRKTTGFDVGDQAGLYNEGPLSKDETIARAIQNQVDTGNWDMERAATADLGKSDLVTVENADGSRMLVTASEAAALGLTPVEQTGSQARSELVQVYNPETQERRNAWVDPNTKEVTFQDDGTPVPRGWTTMDEQVVSETAPGVGNANKKALMERNIQQLDYTLTDVGYLVDRMDAAGGIGGSVAGLLDDLPRAAQGLVDALAGTGLDKEDSVPLDKIKSLARSNPSYNGDQARLAETLYTLAYASVKLQNDGGEVSRYALERSLENLGTGPLSHKDKILAYMDSKKAELERARATLPMMTGGEPLPYNSPYKGAPGTYGTDQAPDSGGQGSSGGGTGQGSENTGAGTTKRIKYDQFGVRQE